jgi:hypothetical protein
MSRSLPKLARNGQVDAVAATSFGCSSTSESEPERKLRASGFSTNFPRSFINIKFHVSPFANGGPRETLGRTAGCSSEQRREASDMKKAVLAIATAGTIGVATLVAPSPAQAWRGGWGPGLAGGLIAGAVIGGIASSAYAYGPGYGYYGGPGYGYYGGYAPGNGGGYAPAYYSSGYAPAYYGGYRSSYYAPANYGPRYRRPYAYYGGPRYYRGYPYGW